LQTAVVAYLLDTDILSNLMKRSPSGELVARLSRVPPEQQFTSSITLGELVYGARRLTERTAILLEKIEGVLVPNLTVLPFDATAARRYSIGIPQGP
jgi:predicted nucleic acid-binding protein